MATTHTVSIKANPALHHGTVSAKRVSRSRQYGACVVATVTQKFVLDRSAKLVADSDALLVATREFQAATAKHGMTLAEAQAKHDVDIKVWFDLCHAARQRIKAERGITYLSGLDKIAEAEVVAAGTPDPYAVGTYNDILNAHWEMKKLTASVERLSQPVEVGDQLVVTWCRDAGLAQRYIAGKDGRHYTEHGYTLEVRTDITVR